MYDRIEDHLTLMQKMTGNFYTPQTCFRCWLTAMTQAKVSRCWGTMKA
jgi:hypothetical protein